VPVLVQHDVLPAKTVGALVVARVPCGVLVMPAAHGVFIQVQRLIVALVVLLARVGLADLLLSSLVALTAVFVSPIVEPSVGRATAQSVGSLRGATRSSPVISSSCPPSSVSTTSRLSVLDFFAVWHGDGGVRAASTLRPELSFRVSSQLSSHAHFLALFLFHTQTQTPSRCVSIPSSLPLVSGPQPCLLRHE